MNNFSTFKKLLLVLSIMVLAGCAAPEEEGGGVVADQGCELTVGLQGNSAIVGSAEFHILLPTGVTPLLDGNSLPSAETTQILVANGLLAINYVPASTGANALISVALIHVDGFHVNSDLLRVRLRYPVGADRPTAGDFDVSVVGATDLNGVEVAGLAARKNVVVR